MMAFVLEVNLLASSSGSRNQSPLVTSPAPFPAFCKLTRAVNHFYALQNHQISTEGETYAAQRYQDGLGPGHSDHGHVAVEEWLDDDDLQRRGTQKCTHTERECSGTVKRLSSSSSST